KSLGGTFDMQGEVPSEGKLSPAKEKANEKGMQGRLRIHDVQVGRLLKVLGATTERNVSGTLNVDVSYTHDTPDRMPRGSGTIRLAGVQWSDALIAENIQGDVVLADGQLRIRDLEGVLANGTIMGQLTYYFRERDRSWFTVRLESVDTERLLAPWFDQKIKGPIQARIRGKMGPVWHGSADIQFARGNVSGLEIGEFRIPANWSFAPDQGHAKIEIAETSGRIARGNAKGKLSLAWQNGARVDGYLRLDRVELTEFMRETVGKSDLVAGQTTAVLQVKGANVRSLKDLEGKLVASFQQAQALQLPVLSQITPFLGIGATTTFQQGNLVARLNRGTAKIEQMTLRGRNAQIFVNGTISLEERMNLNVVAKTTDIGWPTLRLGPIGLRLPVAGPVPLVVAEEVTRLISNQVVYLDVTGTPRSPVIRPRPLPILSAEAIRFFLTEANLPVTLNP
ncbi:MAG TPA: AsmA-like C-terminal region-containing protein, partial [Gemmataceae bacterium]|nr:AsmA-like C-terminal region-containing protein [Gemmataceae bacterium]